MQPSSYCLEMNFLNGSQGYEKSNVTCGIMTLTAKVILNNRGTQSLGGTTIYQRKQFKICLQPATIKIHSSATCNNYELCIRLVSRVEVRCGHMKKSDCKITKPHLFNLQQLTYDKLQRWA